MSNGSGSWKATRGGGGGRIDAQPVRPTLFIGLGGTGLKILARFRRRLFERYGDPDHWQVYSMLGIDTDEHDIQRGGVEDDQGQKLPRNDILDIGLSAAEVSVLRANLKGQYSYLDAWVPDQVHRLDDVGFTDGASQLRPAGRMLFVYHLDDVRREVKRRLKEIRSRDAIADAEAKGALFAADGRSLAADPPPADVVIIGGLAGGTGSGCFLDCAYAVRSLKDFVSLGDIRAMLLLPDVYGAAIEGKKWTVGCANGYGALCELEHFNGLVPRPFSVENWGKEDEEKDIDSYPFQMCYLFSRSNGQELKNQGEVYDLVADALEFSVGGTDLSGRLRSCWSNAKRNAHLGHIEYEELTDKPELGAQDGVGRKSTKLFQRRWSTKFSSLGISSITLKIHELRRLAAIRLMRRILGYEIGAPTERTEALYKEAKDHTDKVLISEDFLGKDLRKKIVAATSHALRSATSATAAETAGNEHMDSLIELVQALANPKTSKLPLADQLNARLEEWSKKHAKALQKQLSSSRDYQRQVTLLAEVESYLKKSVPELERPERPKDPIVLRQWADLDARGTSHLFGLGERALRIIRSKHKNWLTRHSNDYVELMNTILKRRYLQNMVASMETYRRELIQWIRDLVEWDKTLERRQANLAGQFAESRHHVLTTYLAAGPNDENKQAALDNEINRALQEKYRDSGTTHMELAREAALERIVAEFQEGETPDSVLQAKRRLASTHGDRVVLDRLIDILASRVLDNVPEDTDVFTYLADSALNVPAMVASVMGRARAYWPVSEGHKGTFAATTDPEAFAGAEAETKHPAVRRDVLEMITGTDRTKWTHYKFGVGQDGAPRGELVLVNETHGIGLPTLATLPELKKEYDKNRSEGAVNLRHLDYRLLPVLPTLEQPNWKWTIEQIDAWDRALLGILLGMFKWDERRSSYLYRSRNDQNRRVGVDFESIAQWMQQSDTQGEAEYISKQIVKFFDDCANAPYRDDDPAKQAAIAREQAGVLIALDLVLTLLKSHCFGANEADGTSVTLPPAHTMVRRIQYKHVNRALEALEDFLDKSEIEEMKRERRKVLHTRTRFVGPDVPMPTPKPTGWVTPRLVIPAAEGDTDPKVTLREAHERWAKLRDRVPNPNHLKSLFPDYEDDKDRSRIGDLLR